MIKRIWNGFLRFMDTRVPLWVLLVLLNFYGLGQSLYDIVYQEGYQNAIREIERENTTDSK